MSADDSPNSNAPLAHQAVSALPQEADVLCYLREHPRLLIDHPTVLEYVQLEHGVDGATSLIELQMKRLRGQNQELQERLHELVANARDNEAVNRHLQQLAVALLGARTATDTFAEVYQSLKGGFRADWARVRIFAQPHAAPARGCGEFVGADAATTARMLECLHGAKPLLGPLDGETRALLFPDHVSLVKSAALMPLVAPRMRGVLAIASANENRFPVHAGTVFLEHLGELVSQSLARYCDADVS